MALGWVMCWFCCGNTLIISCVRNNKSMTNWQMFIFFFQFLSSHIFLHFPTLLKCIYTEVIFSDFLRISFGILLSKLVLLKFIFPIEFIWRISIRFHLALLYQRNISQFTSCSLVFFFSPFFLKKPTLTAFFITQDPSKYLWQTLPRHLGQVSLWFR